MSKELEKVQGVNVETQYHSKNLDTFSNLLLTSFVTSKPIKHSYYELINKKGKVVQIVVTDKPVIVQSAAYRLGLDYRLVEFEEVYKDLDSNVENKDEKSN